MRKDVAMAVISFKARRYSNPPGGDVQSDFVEHLLRQGVTDPSEEDLMNAAIKVGIPDHELPEFVEEFASRL